jgi:hypothetical protein
LMGLDGSIWNCGTQWLSQWGKWLKMMIALW